VRVGEILEKHSDSIEETREQKIMAEKEKMILAFINKRFRDHIVSF